MSAPAVAELVDEIARLKGELVEAQRARERAERQHSEALDERDKCAALLADDLRIQQLEAGNESLLGLLRDTALKVNKRASDISQWLQASAPECAEEQKHLDDGTQERIYWHYGSLSACQDIARLLDEERITAALKEVEG